MTAVSSDEKVLLQVIILALAVLSLLFSWWSGRAGSPRIAIFGRWIRWLFLGFLISGALYIFNWTGYEFKILLLVCLLGLFLLETAYNWFAISALSKSEFPLFPKFEENDRGEEWPSDPGSIRLKGWLRKAGFKKRQPLISYLEGQVLLRVSTFEDESQCYRLHILFLPNTRGVNSMCLSFFSMTKKGNYVLTDNVFLPFGGFYPESWKVERHPWVRSADKLWKRHLARIDAMAEPLIPFVLTPLEQINEDQRSIEQLNRDLGFLHPIPEQVERGRLTLAGKSRVWQEVWTLSYLGLPLRYS